MTIAAAVSTAQRPIKPDLRARIVAAAGEIADEQRSDGLTIRNIAARAGVSPALLYTYFDGKAALVRELQQLARPQLDAVLATATAGADTPTEGLTRLCIAYVEFARQHRWICEGDDADRRGRTSVVTDAFVERIAALLDGHGASPQTATNLRVAINALVSGDGRAEWESNDGDAQRFVEGYVEMLMRGVALV